MNSNYLKRDIKKHLPSLYAIVLANIQPLEHSLNVKFTENDIAYFVMLIDNAMEDTIDEVSILLITSFDYNTAKYLENKIKRSIRHIKIEKVIHLEEIEKEDLSHYDVVLTTVLLDIEGIIKISRRVDTFDLDLIYKEVKHKRSMKQKIITREEQLFKLDLICNDFKAKRKEDVFEKAVKLLSQQGYTTEAFYDVLLQRENFVSTAIGNGVAIPHGYKSEILKSGIAVIKLDRAIDWNETEKVEIVFIIAIEMDSRKEIYEFFAKFYALIDDQEKLDKIKSAKNKEEIFMAIQDIGAITRE